MPIRWRTQSYLKHRLQKSVWKECSDCSLCTDLAKGPSRLGVHSGGSFTRLGGSKKSLYLQMGQVCDWLVIIFYVWSAFATLFACFEAKVGCSVLFQLLIKLLLWAEEWERHYYFPPWQLASPWWTLSNGLFSTQSPGFKASSILTFPSAPPWCPCKGTSRRWL